nr:hypothetical protein [Zea mays]
MDVSEDRLSPTRKMRGTVELDQYVGIDSSVAYFQALDSSVCYNAKFTPATPFPIATFVGFRFIFGSMQAISCGYEGRVTSGFRVPYLLSGSQTDRGSHLTLASPACPSRFN